MVRYFTVVLVACLGALACQQHTTQLEKSVTRTDDVVVVSTLRTITTAQNAYNLSNGSYGTFEQLSEGGYLDARFNVNKPVVRDYVLTMTVSPQTPSAPSGAYSCNASPSMGDKAGRYFYIDSASSDIHVNATQPATAADEILQP